MQSRTSTWMMALGTVIAFLGICILPAGFGENGDKSVMAGGFAILSLGILAISSGIYLKAIAIPSKPGSLTAKQVAGAGRAIRGACDRCQTDAPVIHCKVHQQHLCGTCLAEHYDFRSCVYAPSTRRASALKSMAAGSGR